MSVRAQFPGDPDGVVGRDVDEDHVVGEFDLPIELDQAEVILRVVRTAAAVQASTAREVAQ